MATTIASDCYSQASVSSFFIFVNTTLGQAFDDFIPEKDCYYKIWFEERID